MPLIVPALTPQTLNVMTTRYKNVLVEVGQELRPLYPFVANITPNLMQWNPQREKEYSSIGQTEAKPEGTEFKLDNIVEGGEVAYTAHPWGKGFKWSIEQMQFDLFGLFDNIAADMIRSGMHRQELEFWAMLDDGFDGALHTVFDGLPLFSQAHPYALAELGIQSNMSSTDISLSVAGIQVMLQHFNLLEDPRGLPDETRRPGVIIIHPSRIPLAREILMSEYMPYSDENTVNSITEDKLKYLPVRYLSLPQPWFVLCRQGLHGLHFKWAIKPLPGAYTDPRTLGNVQTLYFNFAVGMNRWRGSWGSRGTGA